MKQYLISLKSSDFNKADNVWSSDPINLYINDNYSNYSYKRSFSGLDLIGDKTFTGLEIASPSFSDQATPISPNAVYVTDYGEIVYESSTPSLLRFIDTSSRITLLGYRHKFTNLVGSSDPSFNITIYEADEENGPWLETYASGQIGTLFIENVKPYIKVELDIDADEADLNSVGLVFYLEVGINEISSPVASRSAKNILERFPTWTAIYADSVDSATPSLDVPSSQGGKFVTSLVQENLENFERVLDLEQINNYVNSANEDMLAWLNVSYNVPANIYNVLGDGVKLATVSRFDDLKNLRSTDHAYYYNKISKVLYTLRSYDTLTINSQIFDQSAINVFNDFDEFGLRIGLPRLYLESNSNFKKRILDATQNSPSSSLEGLKRTLRRELDLWRAFGATPDSDYLGATPEILEISDIENSTPYFSASGKPEQAFIDFVSQLNEKFPSNYGYARWGEAYWDYAGILSEGVDRIPAVYDEHASPLGDLYNAGVGDFDDIKFSVGEKDAAADTFAGYLELTGVFSDTSVDLYAYTPITISYDVVGQYLYERNVSPDYGAAFVYEVEMPAHGSYATPSVFYCNLSYLDDEDLFVVNNYPQDSDASPEFVVYPVFNSDGLSAQKFEFRDKVYNEVYSNTESTPNSNRISLYDAEAVRVVKDSHWISSSQDYQLFSGDNLDYSFFFDIEDIFDQSATTYQVWNTDSSVYETREVLEVSSPDIDFYNSNLLFVSNEYLTEYATGYTDTVSDVIFLNTDNDLSNSTPTFLTDSDFSKGIIFPHDSTPNSYIVSVKSSPSVLGDFASSPGGTTAHPVTGDQIFVPSSPNIIYHEEAELPYSIEYEWTQLGSDIDGEAASDQSGYSVSISADGTRVAIGAPYNDGTANDSGHVRVYEWSGSAWIQLGSDIDGEASSDYSGISVSLSDDGTIVAIGAYLNDGNGFWSGHVRVYEWNGSAWVQRGSDIDGEASYDQSGISVSLSSDGSIVAIGAFRNTGGGTDSGHVRVYEWNGSAWVQRGSDIDGEAAGDRSGRSVSLSSDGTIVAIGARLNDGTGSSAGHVRVYEWNGTNWAQRGSDIDGEAASDESGRSVSLSADGTRLAVGAPGNDENGSDSGHVRVFEWSGSSWVQLGSDIDGEATGDASGYSVSLSSDGTIVAIGAIYNDGNGSDAGHVRVYEWNSSNWVQVGSDIDGEAASDESGWSVSLSADGTIVAIGARYNDDNGGNAGHVRVLKFSEFSNYSSTTTVISSFYFDSATLNYDNDYSIQISSTPSEIYPVLWHPWKRSVIQTTPDFYQGYIDVYGNAYEATEDPENVFYNDDKFVSNYMLSGDTFSIDSESLFVLDKISIINNNDFVNVYTDNIDQLVADYGNAVLNDETLSFPIYAERLPDRRSAINSGWLHVNEDDYYAYALPYTQQENGRFFEITLDNTPDISAPAIVNVGGVEYRNIAFEDSATPGKIVFSNEESVYANSSDILYLAYENISNAVVIDSYSQNIISSGLFSTSSELSVFDSATPQVIGREYLVRYDVNNAFYIEPDIYDEGSESYSSKIYFSSTPNQDEDYEITYEVDTPYRSDKLYVDLNLDAYENPLDEGFVYLSTQDYAFEDIGFDLSPKYVTDQQGDMMNLVVTSYDTNRNLKPNQTFRIYGDNISATPEYITTNDNGFAVSSLRYSGPTPTATPNDSFYIEGIGSATPNGDPNSESEGFSLDVDFSVLTTTNFDLKIKAVPLRYNLPNGEHDINVYGQVYWRGRPLKAQIDLNWYIGTTLVGVFASTDNTQITTDANGQFVISESLGSYLENKFPGLRFIKIEVADEAAVRSELQSQGKVLGSEGITISGDVVFWNEQYDNVHYGVEDLPLPEFFNRIINPEEDYLNDNSFRYGHSNYDNVVYSDATPGWNPPRWFPIDRYDQYQMGILGSDPDTISTYDNIHPDNEES